MEWIRYIIIIPLAMLILAIAVGKRLKHQRKIYTTPLEK
jgi:hypothetical protein